MWALTRSLTQAPTRCRAWPIPLTAGCGLPCLRRPGGGSGPFVVDAFATCASVQRHPATGQPLPYWTLFLGAQSAVDPLAAGMDAFTARWPGAGAPLWYAFPPVDWVGDLLRLLAQQAARAVLVHPDWPSQWWWPLLSEGRRGSLPLNSLLGAGQTVCVRATAGWPDHPLGAGHDQPHTVQWVASLIDFSV